MIDTKEQLHQRLKDIKTQLRLSMNGAVSQSMREKGLAYKLNFGVELPRIKSIADGYPKDHALAQALMEREKLNEKEFNAVMAGETLPSREDPDAKPAEDQPAVQPVEQAETAEAAEPAEPAEAVDAVPQEAPAPETPDEGEANQ